MVAAVVALVDVPAEVVPGTVCDRWVEWNLTGRLVGDCPLIV